MQDDNSYLLYQEHLYLSSLVIVSDPGDEVEHIYATT